MLYKIVNLMTHCKDTGGTSVVEKVEAALLEGVKLPDKAGLIYVDLHAYDNWLLEVAQLAYSNLPRGYG